jgi:ankyrin repeat protein
MKVKDLTFTEHVPQRMVRPLEFLPEARKHMLRTKDLKIATRGDIAGLKQLLALHPDRLNRRGSHNRTLLWEAVRTGKLPAVEWLVEQGADMNATGRYNGESFVQLTPYCAAVYYHRPAVAEFLRAHGAREDIFRTAYLGDREAVARELDVHPDFLNAEDPQDNLYYVPLLSFAVAGGQVELVNDLLKGGAAVAPYSLQLVSLACKIGRKDILDLLFNYQAQVLPLGEYYFTNTFSLDLLRDLLERGASPSQKGANGFPPLVYLCRADKGEQPEKVRLLLEHHAPVDGLGPQGRTALHYAAAAGFVQVMAILLEHGADFQIKDQQGETPLALAKRYGRERAVELLDGRRAVG